MRLNTAKRRRSVVGLTSLIDVIFLLLLFFMLSSTFSRYSQLDLGVAGSGSGGGERPKLLISIMAQGPMRLNGKPTALDDLDEAIEAYVEKGVTRAVVVPKGEVKLQLLVVALERLKQSGLKSVSLAN
ncbi:ExbD/TolR family protein [Cohaesibacter gelatinilyticus]|uniref:Outer membrane transport energization protein ExbD n=1 Tax=Cohaesibacter gelatinilyticus TaxID=372072 RepID=A0A285PH37_9HYPH|nr:biopolymer transporter ExbD [Cohaesibacter gelatinilyticus]SNZ20593.1 outer membrane transport energization protein ExbD [Cohaesibacter gelatinilyticus]HAT87214.1 biopolymer transporter ExbD [Hyphomicrobiales bacterium]